MLDTGNLDISDYRRYSRIADDNSEFCKDLRSAIKRILADIKDSIFVWSGYDIVTLAFDFNFFVIHTNIPFLKVLPRYIRKWAVFGLLLGCFCIISYLRYFGNTTKKSGPSMLYSSCLVLMVGIYGLEP